MSQGGTRRGEGRGGDGDDEVGDRKRLSWPEHVSIDRMRPPCHAAHHGWHPAAMATRSKKGSRSARSKKTNQPRRSFSFSSRSRLFFILSLASLGSAAACFTGKEARFEIRDMRRGNHAVRAANERCCSRAATNFFPCGVGGRRQAKRLCREERPICVTHFF
jgi:hypothetical protein